ncbi:MAG: AI-2E family transporter [Clostridia bacterium]
MKQDENKTFDFKFLNTVMYIGAIIIAYYVLKNIGIMDKIIGAFTALIPILFGLVICWISQPLANKLKKIGLNKNIAAILSLVIIFGIIITVFSFVIPIFVDQMTNLIKDFPNIYSSVVNKVNFFLSDKFGFIGNIHISPNLKDLEFIKGNMGNIIDFSINTLQSVFGIIIAIGTTIVVSFFMVKDMDKFKSEAIAFLSRKSKDGKRYKMLVEIDATIMSYIKGMAIDSFIVGLMTTVVCIVLRLDYAIIFGILIMLLNLIPYIGAIVSYTITSLYALAVGGPVLAIITFVSLFMVQLIDANILQPNIVAKSVKLHPVVVLAGLIVFELFFGIFGMIIAMPILATIKIIIKHKFELNFDDENLKVSNSKLNIAKVREKEKVSKNI